MGPSREKTLQRALDISDGVSRGVLGLRGPLPVSDWAGAAAELGQLVEGEPLLSFLCFSSACCSHHDNLLMMLHAGSSTDCIDLCLETDLCHLCLKGVCSCILASTTTFRRHVHIPITCLGHTVVCTFHTRRHAHTA